MAGRTFLLRGYSEGKSARYRLARISTSRSTYRHSAVLRSRRTISSKASACSGAYSTHTHPPTQVRAYFAIGGEPQSAEFPGPI
jgi:hypothetical protein